MPCGVARVFCMPYAYENSQLYLSRRKFRLYQIVYVISATVRFLLVAIQFLMLARAIISWLPIDEDNSIVTFLYTVTEFVVAPVRAVVEHFGWFEGLPIDMSFFIAFMLLSILEMFL